MNKKSLNNTDFISRDFNPLQRLKYLDYLQQEENEEDYIDGVRELMGFLEESEIIGLDEDPNVLVRITQHCLNASGKLFLQNLEAEAFDLLEMVRNQISNTKGKDASLEKVKTVLYNNIASYCIGLGEDAMAVKFLQNCLRDDIGTNSCLTGIFYNNLSSIYLTHANYEKAFRHTKKAIYLLEPEIFAEIKEKSSRALREDPAFLKKLTILLVGYLNMASTLEAIQLKNTFGEPSKEMADLNPKDFYKNSYGLAKRYLGPDHQLTQRLEYCNTKTEFMLFKEIPTEPSDFESLSSPQQRLKKILNQYDNEDKLRMKKTRTAVKIPQGLSQSINTRSLPKDFQIRKNSYQRHLRHRQKVDSSATSYDSSVEGGDAPRRTVSHYFQNEYSRPPQFIPPEDTMTMTHSMYRRPRTGEFRPDMYPQNSFVSTPDSTHIIMELMYQQKRDLEDKLYRKFDELRSVSKLEDYKSASKFNSFDNTEPKTLDSKDKEDPKVQILQQEVESLREKLLQMKIEKELEHKARAKESTNTASRKQSADSTASYQPSAMFGDAKRPASPHTPKKNESPKKAESHQNLIPPAPKEKEIEKATNPQKFFPTKPAPPKQEHEVFEIKRPMPHLVEKEAPPQQKPTLPLTNASPISKNEKFYEPQPQAQQVQGQTQAKTQTQTPVQSQPQVKKKAWVPGKYSDPKTRQFNLDISKVDALGYEDEMRNRGDGEEEKFEMPAPKPAGGNTAGAVNNKATLGEQAQKQGEKGTLKRAKVEKVGLGTKSSTPNGAQEDEDQPPKQPEPVVEKPSTPVTQKNGTTPTTSNMDDSKMAGGETIKSDTSDRYKSFNIESVDSPKGAQLDGGILKLPKYAVLRKRVFLEDDAQYLLVCTARWTREEKVFKLQLIHDDDKQGTETGKVESELELAYKDLCRILEHVEYKDVMPVTFHINQIKTFYTLMRHLLLPFTTVITTEEGKKEIAIYPKPPNLLTNSINDMPIIKFLGIQCVIIFTHVARNTFRIILTDPEAVDEAVRIDVDFDKTSFDQCFQRINGNEANLRAAETSVKIIHGFDDDADDDEVNEFREINKKMTNPARCDEEELDSFKVINKDLVEDLGNVLKEMDGFLNSIGITELSQLADEKRIKYCKLKLNNKMKKSTLHIIQDRAEKQVLELKVKNFFETFAPNSKVKALGEHDYPYESVWKHFGLTYTQLEYQDKLAICSMISEIYHLDVFEKEIQKEDFDRYEENAIAFVPMEVGAYNRVFLGEKHKFPLTLSLVGIRGEPRGIRATIYNVDEAYEVGAFFHVNPVMWSINENGDKKKKKTGRMATLTLIEHYYLELVLRKCGWEIVKDALLIEKKPHRIDIKGIKVNKGCKHMEQLENILNTGSVLKYLMEKDNS